VALAGHIIPAKLSAFIAMRTEFSGGDIPIIEYFGNRDPGLCSDSEPIKEFPATFENAV
jgi:hypothetical protein